MIREVSRRYEDYKDSGVEWIGDIPQDWEVKRVKELGNLVLGKMLDNKQGVDKFLKPYLKSKNIGWLKITDSNVEEMYFSSYEMKLYRIRQGDLLFSEGGEVGKTSYWNGYVEECYIQNSVHKFTANKNNNSRYLLYLSFAAGHAKYYDNIVNFVSIKHLTKEKLARIVWLSPPLPEQKSIADYLDTKTAQIDKKVHLLTQKAAHYSKLKQSLINETVTRGLDKTVAMKDSGVEWIGDIPEHWSVERIGTAFEERRERVNDTDYPPLSVTMKGIVPQLDTAAKTDHNDNRKRVASGDYVINSRSDRRGSSGISELNGSVSVINIVLAPKKNFHGKYLHHLFRSYRFIEEFYRVGRGIVDDLWTTKYSVMKAIDFSFPDHDEQKSIADYLDTKTAKIDTIVKSINSQIEHLKELRKTLINDVVTGQIKVI